MGGDHLLKYRMIALDVDGTLIDDRFQIQPKTKGILKELYDDGVEIALCTGRNPSGAIPLMEEIGVEGPVIVHNGALSLHSTSKEIYGTLGFHMSELQDVVEFCRAQGIHFDVNTPFHLYVERMDPRLERLYQSYFAQPILLRDVMELDEDVVKLSLLGEEELIDRLVGEIEERFPYFRSIRSGENYIDIMHPDASKGYGLRIVAEKLNIPLDEIVAFGNYYNDIEMLAEVGFGIAMENSPIEVKNIAKAVTRSNNEEGIYYGLREHFYKDSSAHGLIRHGIPKTSFQWNR